MREVVNEAMVAPCIWLHALHLDDLGLFFASSSSQGILFIVEPSWKSGAPHQSSRASSFLVPVCLSPVLAVQPVLQYRGLGWTCNIGFWFR